MPLILEAKTSCGRVALGEGSVGRISCKERGGVFVGLRGVGELMAIATTLVASGCDSSTSSQAPDAMMPDALYCPATPATRLDAYDSGLVNAATARIPIVASPGDLLVVSIATLDANFGRPQVANGKNVIQVGMGSSPCGRHAVLWTVGDIQAPLDHVDVQMDHSGSFDIFIARFAGLPADAGSHEALFAHSWSGEAAPWSGDAPRVSVCGGAAVVTTMISCAPLTLRADSGFTLIGSAEGMASAALIPTESGPYGADWNIGDQWSAFTVAFPRRIPL